LIYQLMQLDPSRKAIRFLIVIGVILSLLPSKFYITSIILVLFTMLFCRINKRASAFQVSLPISGRQIFAARLLSILVALWTPAITASAILVFRGSTGSATAIALLGNTALATLAVIIVQSIRIRELEIRKIWAFLVIPLTFYVSGIGMMLLLHQIFGEGMRMRLAVALILAVCLLASAILFIRIWKRVPKSFQMAAEPNANPVSAAAIRIWKYILKSFQIASQLVASSKSSTAPCQADVVRTDMRGSRALAWRPILRSVYPWSYFIWLMAFFSVSWGYGFVQMYVFVATMIMCIFTLIQALWTSTRVKISWLYALPVSRSAILLLFMLPPLLSLVAGYSVGIGYSVGMYEGSSAKHINILSTQTWPPATAQAGCKICNIVPPIEFWRPAHAGRTPAIHSPWGETFQPPISMFHGYRVYNPYAVGAENSQRFFDWQFAQATIAAYGRSIPQSEYQHPVSPLPMIPPLRIRMLHIALIIALALIALFNTEVYKWRRFLRLSKPLRMILIIIPFTGIVAFWLRLLFNGAFWDTLIICISWTLPDNALIAIIAVAIPLAGLYWIADKIFKESEIMEAPKLHELKNRAEPSS
jgi:hypothetical protein